MSHLPEPSQAKPSHAAPTFGFVSDGVELTADDEHDRSGEREAGIEQAGDGLVRQNGRQRLEVVQVTAHGRVEPAHTRHTAHTLGSAHHCLIDTLDLKVHHSSETEVEHSHEPVLVRQFVTVVTSAHIRVAALRSTASEHPLPVWQAAPRQATHEGGGGLT